MKVRLLAVAAFVLVGFAGVTTAGAVTGRPSRRAGALEAHVKGTTGNAAVIAFYRKVVAATKAADGASYAYGASAPFDQLKLLPKGAWSVYAESWPHAGYYPVDDTFYVGATNGRVSFVTDTIVWAGHGRQFGTFGEVLTARGEVELFGNAAASTTPTPSQLVTQPCGGPVHGPVAGFSKVGGASGYGLYGDFRSMKRVGPNEVVVSTYPFGKGHVATETDVIDRATDLPISGRTVVSAAPAQPSYTMAWTVTWYHVPIYLPNTTGACLGIESGVAV